MVNLLKSFIGIFILSLAFLSCQSSSKQKQAKDDEPVKASNTTSDTLKKSTITTVSALRSHVSTQPGALYQTTDNGGGTWIDAGINNGKYKDNTGTILITANKHVLKRRYSGIVDVRWFGAKGNGTETKALQMAIDNVGDNETLLIPAGVTLHSNAISLKSNMKFKIEGLLVNANSPLLQNFNRQTKIGSDYPVIHIDGKTNIEIDGAHILSDKYEGIAIYNSKNIIIKNTTVTGSGKGNPFAAIFLYHDTNVTVSNITVKNIGLRVTAANLPVIGDGGDAILFHGCSNVSISGAKITAVRGTGIYFFNTSDIKCIGNNINNADCDGVFINQDNFTPNAVNAVIQGNTIKKIGSDAIDLTLAGLVGRNKIGKVRVTGNTTRDVGWYTDGSPSADGTGICTIRFIQDVTVADNTGTHFRASAFYVEDASNIVIHHNTSSNSQYFVRVSGPVPSVHDVNNLTIDHNIIAENSLTLLRVEGGHNVNNLVIAHNQSNTARFFEISDKLNLTKTTCTANVLTGPRTGAAPEYFTMSNAIFTDNDFGNIIFHFLGQNQTFTNNKFKTINPTTFEGGTNISISNNSFNGGLLLNGVKNSRIDGNRINLANTATAFSVYGPADKEVIVNNLIHKSATTNSSIYSIATNSTFKNNETYGGTVDITGNGTQVSSKP